METMTVVETLTKISCGQCGGVYAIGERYRQKRHEEGNGWHCPYCETAWGYFKNGENAILKRRIEQLQNTAASLRQSVEYHSKESEHFRASRNAIKGVVTKIKRRVGNGVCPCCNRTFQDLKRHMDTQHPQFNSKDA